MFENVYQIVNEYRPHQARERLIEMMEERIERGRKEVEEIERLKGRVGVLVGGDTSGDGGAVDGGDRASPGRPTKRESEGIWQKEHEDRRLWKALLELKV